jgi:HAD superfamily hydrolase (TIGR01509 family)
MKLIYYSTVLSHLLFCCDALKATPRFRGLLFDIDGTLVNTDPIHFAVFRDLLLQDPNFNGGEPIDHNFFNTRISGRQNNLIQADLFPQRSAEDANQWSLLKEARFRELSAANIMDSKTRGLDGIRSWADKQGMKVCAVTNAPRDNAEAILHGIDYFGWFGDGLRLVIGDECMRAKPDPLPYLIGADLIGVPIKDCIVFEDSPAGVQAGKAAGAFVVGIMSGQSFSTLEAAGCSLVVKDFESEKLWDFLRQISSSGTE